MTTTPSTPSTPVSIHADHETVKHLGNWTTVRSFEVRARYAQTVLDLRSPEIEDGDIEIRVEIDHAMLELFVPESAILDQTQLRWTGRGRVKDSGGYDTTGGRRVQLSGHIDSGEVRVRRGGVAILKAMFTREYLEDAKRAYREGTVPTVDDPTREG